MNEPDESNWYTRVCQPPGVTDAMHIIRTEGFESGDVTVGYKRITATSQIRQNVRTNTRTIDESTIVFNANSSNAKDNAPIQIQSDSSDSIILMEELTEIVEGHNVIVIDDEYEPIGLDIKPPEYEQPHLQVPETVVPLSLGNST